MKQSNENIENVMGKVLQQHTTSVQFEAVWNKVPKNKRRKFTFRKAVQMPLVAVISILALFMVGFTSYNVFRNIDKTDYPFIDDARVKGKWESVDFVKKIQDFDPMKKSYKSDLYLNSLVFNKDGQMLMAVNNGNLASTPFTWTKDMVLNKQDKTASKYSIRDINGITYMFFEWKSGDYVYRGMKPWYYVLKNVDNNDYSNYQVKAVKQDQVDYPFIDDAEMKGKWESVDFVQSIVSFKPGRKSSLESLFLTGLNFDENGKLTVITTYSTTSSPLITWTKGMVLDNGETKTASKCDIKNIDGTTYMFFEWKSGDYVYRGMKPWYYVLKKAK